MSARRLLCMMAALTLIIGGVTIATVKALPLDLIAAVQNATESRMEIRLAETTPAAGLQEARTSSGERIYLHPMPIATWADVSVVKIVDAGNSQVGLAMTLESAAASRLAITVCAPMIIFLTSVVL